METKTWNGTPEWWYCFKPSALKSVSLFLRSGTELFTCVGPVCSLFSLPRRVQCPFSSTIGEMVLLLTLPICSVCTAAWPSIKALSCVCVCYGVHTGLNLVYCGPQTAWCSKLIGAGAFQEVRLPLPHVIETLVTVIACYKHMEAPESHRWLLSLSPCACCLYIHHSLHLFWIIIYYIIMMSMLIVIVIVVLFFRGFYCLIFA